MTGLLLSTEFGQSSKINKNKDKLTDTVNNVDTMAALKSDIAAGCSVVHCTNIPEEHNFTVRSHTVDLSI